MILSKTKWERKRSPPGFQAEAFISKRGRSEVSFPPSDKDESNPFDERSADGHPLQRSIPKSLFPDGRDSEQGQLIRDRKTSASWVYSFLLNNDQTFLLQLPQQFLFLSQKITPKFP
jgi:hypothetical protein